MDLTYGDVIRAIPALGELLKLKPAPTVALCVKMARNGRKLQAVANDFGAARDRVVETLRDKYTETWEDDEGEEQTGIPKAREAAFEAEALKEINELALEPVKVDVRVIMIADLEKCEDKRPGFEIPANVLFDLWYMFDLDEPELESAAIAEAA